jgi:hypothetical protein
MRRPDSRADMSDGGSGDDNRTIGPFAGARMDVPRESSPGDREPAKVSAFVSVKELRTIRDGVRPDE